MEPETIAIRDEGRPCPNCRVLIAPGGVVCIECGHDIRSGRQARALEKPLTLRWNGRAYVGLRAGMVLAIWGAITLLVVAVMVKEPAPPPLGKAPAITVPVEATPKDWTRATWIIGGSGVVLFLLWGNFSQLTLRRDAAGRCRLTRWYWLLFVPVYRQTRNLSDFAEIRLQDPGRVRLPPLTFPLHILTYERFDERTVLPRAFVRNVLEEWRRSWLPPWELDRYDANYEIASASYLELVGPRVAPMAVFWGTNDDKMRSIVGAVTELAGLTFRRG